MNNTMEKLIIDLFEKKIISNTINFNTLLTYPYLINNIVIYIYNKIKYIDYNNIIGITNISSHITSILSHNHNIPILMFSKDKKIEGNIGEDNKTILIIDKLYSGRSIMNYINTLESNKINIKFILTLYSSDNKKLDFFDKYNIISLFNENYITKVLTTHNLINTKLYYNLLHNEILDLKKQKRSKLGYECKLTNIKDIISEVDNIGEHIIILKICSYKIENFCINYGNALSKLAKNHNFIIIDDLGLNNLDHINLNNYKWANILTTYKNNNNNCNLLYINNNNDDIMLNNNYVGTIGSYTNNYINFTNTITDIEELKKNINYDIVIINSNLFTNKIISYINSMI